MARKTAPAAAPMPHHVQVGQMAAQGMAAAPSNEIGGIMGHFAHLNQTVGTPAPVVAPGKKG